MVEVEVVTERVVFLHLYLFDKMLEHQIMDNETAIDKLQSLFSINSRLPKKEIDKRIALWKEALKQ